LRARRVVFELLHPAVRRALEERGFREPTEPQRLAIPEILAGSNVLVVAPTGTGKTEAAVLPVLSRMLELGAQAPGIYALYITPLRALNRDLLDRIKWWGERAGLRVDVRHGDTDRAERQRQSRQPPHVLITTPEMLQAVMTGRRLLGHLRELRWVVVDEVHELAEDKRGVQLSLALERLRYHVGRDLQIIGLSATVGSPEEVARFLVGAGRPFKVVMVGVARRMQLDVVRPAPAEEDKRLAEAHGLHPEVVARLRLVRRLVEGARSALIFVNTRSMAELLSFRMSYLFGDLPVAVHHSSLSKAVRVSVEQRMRRGELKAIVATSSLELGIDVGHIDLVVQYMSPHQVTRLVQRVGRSGHSLSSTPRGVVVCEDVNDTMEAMVIARRARAGLLEPVKVPSKPYDVLVNQIAAFLILKPRWSLAELYEVIRRAYPYRDLTLDELRRIVKFMGELHPRLALYFEDSDTVVRPRSRGFYRYFYENLSMIPDERQYAVIDARTGELVGTLDESFVAEYGSAGVKFIFRGRPWVIVGVDGRGVRVVEVQDPSGAVPSWIGEEIPVPLEVAQEVGALRRRARGGDHKAIAEEYGVSEETARYAVGEVLKHEGPLPDDRTVVAEQYGENVVIVHAAFGTLVNRTLARLLGELLARIFERPVGVQPDPYGIVIQSSERVSAELVGEQLKRLAAISAEELLELLKAALVKSGAFKWRLLHVAKRMGAVDKDADVHSVSMSKLVEAFGGTPVFDEALKESLERDLDVEGALEVLARIRRGEICVVRARGPTHLGRVLYERVSHRLEVIPPERLKRLVIDSTKARLLNHVMVVACLDCGWHDAVRVGELSELKCARCGGRNLGALRSARGDSTERELKRRAEELARTAELIRRHGWLALYALAARVPVGDVERILLEVDGASLDAVTERLLEAEREHLKKRLLES